jgi:hypothetical protein
VEDLTSLFGDGPEPPPGPTAPARVTSTPNLDALAGEAVVSAPAAPAGIPDEARVQARGMSAIRAQTAPASRPPARAELLDGFRVRTARGLTYDFPHAAAMERWLDERDDLEGCEVGQPGQAWMPAQAYLARVRAKDRPLIGPGAASLPSTPVDVQPSQPLVGIGERAPLPRVARPAVGPLPPVRPRAGGLAWSLAVVSSLLVLAAAALTAARYGVLDLSPYLPLESLGILPPKRLAPQAGPVEGLPGAPARVEPALAYGQALQAARTAMAQKRFSRAALEFNRALVHKPGAPEALDGLAQAYQALGDAERALAVRRKAQEIQQR